MEEPHSRRSALLHLAAVAVLFLGYGLELLAKVLDLVPQKQASRVVAAEGHAAGHATVVATAPADMTWKGSVMLVSEAPSV